MSLSIPVNIVDLSQAMENLEGDVELLQEIVDIFVDMGPDQLDSIENCIAVGDANSVQTQAHGMKGGASNFRNRSTVRGGSGRPGLRTSIRSCRSRT